MCKIKSRFVVALLAFGIGVLGVSLWLIKSPISQPALKETEEIKEVTSEIRGFNEVVSAKDGTYVTVQGWIDPKYLCQGKSDSELSTCTTALVGKSPAEESMYIQLQLCNELVIYSCIVHDSSQPYYNAKIYDYNSNLINIEHQIKVTGGITVIEGKGQFRNEIGRVESIDDSQKTITPVSKIDLSKVGHIHPKGRVQDVDYTQSRVIEDLIANGKESIPFLINKLTDETEIEGQVIDFWSDERVGDIAFVILTSFFLDSSWEKPTIKGAEFREFLDCKNPDFSSDYCLYKYIEKYGRKKIKAKWQKIWKENEDKIYWDESERCFRLRA